LASLAATANAAARAYAPGDGHVFAGLTGGTAIGPYEQMAGKHPPVFESYMTWNTSTRWLARPDRSFRSRIALHISTAPGYGRPGVITPAAIARGESDRFLVALNRHLAESGRIFYIRLMAEMNGYWNPYAAFDANGRSRGASHSPRAYVRAWRRSVLIIRGGRTRAIDRRLRGLGLPRLSKRVRRLARLPRPKVAFLWVPQDAGSPETAANAPGVFWPGSGYVDWVGTDFYASYPNFALLDDLYDEFGGKPFVLSEWGLYGSDRPAFVRELFAWARAHPRVKMLNYYQGFAPGAWRENLARYPRSRHALRAELRSKRFLSYPAEYRHPPEHRHKPPAPPQPPEPGPPPSLLPPLPRQLCIPLLNLCIPLPAL
jgi:hypothetical protein